MNFVKETCTIILENYLSLPKEIKYIEDIEFYLKFEHSLFGSKSESSFSDTVVDFVSKSPTF